MLQQAVLVQVRISHKTTADSKRADGKKRKAPQFLSDNKELFDLMDVFLKDHAGINPPATLSVGMSSRFFHSTTASAASHCDSVGHVFIKAVTELVISEGDKLAGKIYVSELLIRSACASCKYLMCIDMLAHQIWKWAWFFLMLGFLEKESAHACRNHKIENQDAIGLQYPV